MAFLRTAAFGAVIEAVSFGVVAGFDVFDRDLPDKAISTIERLDELSVKADHEILDVWENLNQRCLEKINELNSTNGILAKKKVNIKAEDFREFCESLFPDASIIDEEFSDFRRKVGVRTISDEDRVFPLSSKEKMDLFYGFHANSTLKTVSPIFDIVTRKFVLTGALIAKLQHVQACLVLEKDAVAIESESPADYLNRSHWNSAVRGVLLLGYLGLLRREAPLAAWRLPKILGFPASIALALPMIALYHFGSGRTEQVVPKASVVASDLHRRTEMVEAMIKGVLLPPLVWPGATRKDPFTIERLITSLETAVSDEVLFRFFVFSRLFAALPAYAAHFIGATAFMLYKYDRMDPWLVLQGRTEEALMAESFFQALFLQALYQMSGRFVFPLVAGVSMTLVSMGREVVDRLPQICWLEDSSVFRWLIDVETNRRAGKLRRVLSDSNSVSKEASALAADIAPKLFNVYCATNNTSDAEVVRPDQLEAFHIEMTLAMVEQYDASRDDAPPSRYGLISNAKQIAKNVALKDVWPIAESVNARVIRQVFPNGLTKKEFERYVCSVLNELPKDQLKNMDASRLLRRLRKWDSPNEETLLNLVDETFKYQTTYELYQAAKFCAYHLQPLLNRISGQPISTDAARDYAQGYSTWMKCAMEQSKALSAQITGLAPQRFDLVVARGATMYPEVKSLYDEWARYSANQHSAKVMKLTRLQYTEDDILSWFDR